MSSATTTRSSRGRQAALAALVLASMAGFGFVFWGGSREGALKDAIQRATSLKQWDKVEAGLHRWLKDHPLDGDAWEMLGGLLFDLDREGEAAEALRNVPEASRGWGHAQALLGEIAVRSHQLSLAEASFRRACQREPRAIEPLRRLSSLLVLERRPAEARDVLRQLFKVTRDPRTLAESILISQLESEIRDMGPEIEEHLHAAPEDPWLRRVWGLYLLSHARPAEALPHLEAAARAIDDDPLGRFALAECRMALGKRGDDLSILGAPPTRAADAARWWVLRARLAEAWKRDKDAFESLTNAVVLDPRNSEAHYRLGQLMTRRGDRRQAQLYLDRAASLGLQEDTLKRELRRLLREETDATALRRIGQLCLDSGMTALARDWYELAALRDPAHAPARADLSSSAPEDDGPTVALSRPVLKMSALAHHADHASSVGFRPAAEPRFEDIAERAGIRYQYDSGTSDRLFIADTMGGGVGLIDYDRDGWLDIYFVNGCSIPWDEKNPPRPNRLYRNMGDGTFRDVTAKAGVTGSGYGMGCAVGDFDNDGYDDLFVTGLYRTILYHNRGDGTFEDVTARAGVVSDRWTTAAGFGDLDGDGDLDLVVITYVEIALDDTLACQDHAGQPIHCTPARYPAQFDLLFRNNGDGTFTNVSREAGIEVPEGKGLGLAIADLDGDGRLDLFVANDGTPNFLFHNKGGLRFEEVGLAAGVAYDGAGLPTASMGVVAEDISGDGKIDLFHVNFVNQTSTLRINLGEGQFIDGTLAANLGATSRSRTGFGAVALDADNDGVLDLFVANGHTDHQPWVNTPMAQLAQLFLGRGDGRFELAGAGVSPYFSRPIVGRGVAAGDLDNDGRIDLVVVHRDAPAALLRNTSKGGHWLGVRLRGTRSSRTPVGARVVCRAGGRSTTRWLTSGTGYLSSSDPRIWFGLASARTVERLEVRWHSGIVQTWSDLAADRILDLVEGDDRVVPARSAAARGAEPASARAGGSAMESPNPSG
jgi:tetratricopeptide (TPR) repeat protein